MAGDGKKKKNAKPASVAKRKYNSTDKQKKRRASRNQARRKAMKSGKVRKGDGKDIHHKNKNAMDNRPSNLAVKSKKSNRADNGGKGGRPKAS